MDELLKRLFPQGQQTVYNDFYDTPKWYERPMDMEGRYTLLPLRDTMPGSVFNEREWAVPGLLAEIANAVTAPGRAISGQLDEPDAPNFALNMMGGGLLASRTPTAMGAGGTDLGMFAGRGARTADLDALRRFEQMQAENLPASQTWQETGWMKGPEGLPRFEISDDASLISPFFDPTKLPNVQRHSDFQFLPDVLIHPDLYRAYPELRDYRVGAVDNRNIVGAYDHTNRSILLGGDYRQSFLEAPNELRSTMLHEIQHAVQRLEGFERGGSPQVAPKILTEQARAELNTFSPNLSSAYDHSISNLGFASNRLYLHKLDDVINSSNIRPSTIRRLSDWYEHSSNIINNFGVAPTKAGPARDEWYRNAARYIKNQNLEKRPALSNYQQYSQKDLNNVYRRSDRQLDKIRDDYFKMRKTAQKYQELGKLSDYQLYERIAGEAEARLVEARTPMSPSERRAQFPFRQLDVPYNELLYRSLLD